MLLKFFTWILVKLNLLDQIVMNHYIYNNVVDEKDKIHNQLKDFLNVNTELNDTIKKYNDFKDNLGCAIIELDAYGNESKEQCGAISEEVISISSIVEQLAASNEQTASATEELTSQISLINNIIKSVSDKSVSIDISSQKNKNDIANIKCNIESTYDRFNEKIHAIIEAANSKIYDVEELTKIILNISESVKLLALNATIEAARVGEAGRGFAVVAQEMSKLADSSASTANNVLKQNKEIIGSIQTLSNSTEEILAFISNDIAKFSDESYNIAVSTCKNINEMTEDLKKIKVSIDNINNSSDQQANVAQESAKAIYDTAESIQGINEKIKQLFGVTSNTKQSIDSIAHMVLQ